MITVILLMIPVFHDGTLQMWMWAVLPTFREYMLLPVSESK
jgi:hypothetical protein